MIVDQIADQMELIQEWRQQIEDRGWELASGQLLVARQILEDVKETLEQFGVDSEIP